MMDEGETDITDKKALVEVIRNLIRIQNNPNFSKANINERKNKKTKRWVFI